MTFTTYILLGSITLAYELVFGPKEIFKANVVHFIIAITVVLAIWPIVATVEIAQLIRSIFKKE